MFIHQHIPIISDCIWPTFYQELNQFYAYSRDKTIREPIFDIIHIIESLPAQNTSVDSEKNVIQCCEVWTVKRARQHIRTLILLKFSLGIVYSDIMLL